MNDGWAGRKYIVLLILPESKYYLILKRPNISVKIGSCMHIAFY